ncbi:MAG: hypothetical protein ABJE95_12915 [Byssovorax sp.]
MSNAHTATDANQSHPALDKNEQFPGNTHVTKAYFDSNSSVGDLVRIVIMSANETTNCVANHEYHYGNTDADITSITSFTLRTGTLDTSQTAIDAFAGSLPLHLQTAQAPSWSRGAYTPTGAHNRLFKAVDPDDSTRMIAVLIEQSAHNVLTRITWYKTQDAGAIFATAPTALAFEVVKNESGVPSLDPNDIAGWTWYHTTSIAL